MKVAVDVSPISEGNVSGHKVRGVGSYITSLKNSLEKYDKENTYTFFSQKDEIKKDVDVVHYPYFEPFFLTLPFFKKTKTVVTVHDLTPLAFPKDFPKGTRGFFKWQIQKAALKRADVILTDSAASKKDIVRLLGIAPSKVSVVYLAADEEFTEKTIDVDSRAKLLKKFNLPEKFGLYVGDATANKNLPRLVEAVNKAQTPLVLVGKALSERTENKNSWNRDLISVQKEIKNNHLFIPVGFVSTEELVVLYNLATFLILPSLYEGFGLPILEAMSCGCPVITTKQGSIPEIAGDSAFIVDAYDVNSIADGIKKVFDSESIQKDLAKKGKVQVAKFSWKKTAEETVRVYESCLKDDK